MSVNISHEALVFLASFISGIIIGIVYDIFKVFGFYSKKKNFLFTLYDIIFLLLFSIIIISVFYIFNSYELRWFMFIGLILGLILYIMLISKAFIYLFGKLIAIILKIFKFIFKILLTPTQFLGKILLVYIFIPISKFLKSTYNFARYKFTVYKSNRGKSNDKKKRKKRKNK